MGAAKPPRIAYDEPVTVSAVIVAYRSSAYLPALLASLEGVAEVIVVDHSEDAVEAATLGALGVDRLVVEDNRGYGAGLNRGVRESTGDVLLLLNPDVVLRPGAVAALRAAVLTPGVAAAGPILEWDEAGRWRLPHSPPLEWRAELRARLAPRAATLSYLRHELALWTAEKPVTTPVIGGAVMATTRDAFVASGGFDERFFLFFEENDWCRRLAARGGRLLITPAARALHPYGRAIGAAAAVHFEHSLELFRRLYLPPWYLRLFPRPPRPATPRWPRVTRDRLMPGDLLLLGHSPRFVPAAFAVWRDGDDDPAALLPAHADPTPYHLGTLQRDEVRDLGMLARADA